MSTPQPQSGRRWIGWAIYGVLALIILVESATILYYAKVRPLLSDMQYRDNFTNISRAIDWDKVRELGYFPDELPLQKALPLSNWSCRACGARYVYSPVAPSGDRITLEWGRFFLWAPCRLHERNARAMIFTFGTFYCSSDDDVSWYYQRIVSEDEPLNEEQFAKENDYRRKMHVPVLERPEGAENAKRQE